MPITFVYPDYWEDFHCIGGECEDSCCIGWDVYIDKATYWKYRGITDPQFKQQMGQRIRLNKGPTANDFQFAQIKMASDRRCPFMNEQSLCDLQLNYGPHFLSRVCQTYPRQASRMNKNIVHLGLSLACPEVVRAAVFHPKPISFIQSDGHESVPGMTAAIEIPKDSYKADRMAGKFAWEVQATCIDILQSQKYVFPQRMLLLGMMLQMLSTISPVNEPDDFLSALVLYRSVAESGELGEQLSSYKQVPEIFNPMVETIIKNVLSNKSLAHYTDILSKVYVTSNVLTASPSFYTKQAEEQLAARDRFLQFSNDNPHILENYFVSTLFYNASPFNPRNTVFEFFDAFILMAVEYAVFRLLYASSDSSHTGHERLLNQIIRDTERVCSHNHLNMAKVLDSFKENDQAKLSDIACLLLP